MVSRWTSVCLSVRPFVRPSVRFSFPDDNLSKNINAFSPNLVCALILWRSALGLLMGKFRQILTKLAICIDIKEIWFGIANGQISSIFYGVICPRHVHIFVS